MPVDDHGHVVLEERAPLGDDHHAGLAGRFDDLLRLIAARLVVALHADRADRFHPAQVEEGIVEVRDVGFERALRAVEDRAGRENARPDDLARALHLRRGEDLRGVVRGIVERGHAEGEGRVVVPALLRDDLVRPPSSRASARRRSPA